LEGYDYTAPGFYFVTLCIQDRLPVLGRVNGGEMQLSPRFHDRIIRDDEELRVKREYTIQNPLRWSLKEAGL